MDTGQNIIHFDANKYERNEFGFLVHKSPSSSLNVSDSSVIVSGDASIKGLGDLVGIVATPVARLLKLPCIDPATKQLRPDSPCAKRKAALNNAVSFEIKK